MEKYNGYNDSNWIDYWGMNDEPDEVEMEEQ